MTRFRLPAALIATALSYAALAATPPVAAQPEFTPLRAKNPSQSKRVEKPELGQRLGTTVRTEMRGVVGLDGQVHFECRDASHQHVSVRPLPSRETK